MDTVQKLQNLDDLLSKEIDRLILESIMDKVEVPYREGNIYGLMVARELIRLEL